MTAYEPNKIITSFPLLLANIDGEIVYANQSLSRLLGIPNNNIIGKTIYDIFTVTENSVHHQSWHNHKLTKIYSPLFANLTSSNKKNTYRLDIAYSSESKNIEIIVHQENDWYVKHQNNTNKFEQLINTIEATNLGIWEYHLTHHQIEFSKKLKELIGVHNNQDISWRQFIKKIHKDDQTIFNRFFKGHIEFNIPLDFEFRIYINNKIHWFTIKGETFSKGNSKVIMGTLVDCTAEKEILYKLNDAIESKNIAMSVGKIGTWQAEVQPDETWLWNWDDIANNMFGLLPEDKGIIEKWADRLHPEDRDRVWSALESSLDEGITFSQNYRAIMPCGEIRYFIGKGRVSQSNLGDNYRIDGICVDQTVIETTQLELKKLNSELENRVELRTEELKKSKEKAEKASQIKTDFLSMMSHELRTPMNAVIGSLDLLQSTKQNTEARELIDTAKSSAENLVFILNDILDINKIEAGKLDLEDLTFSLSEIIDNVVKVFIPVAQKKSITLKVIEDPNIPAYVKGDAIRVRQILFNLLGNALKFTPSTTENPGEVTLKITEIEKNDFVSNICIQVIDNGIGINEENQKNLFKPFMQAELSTTRKYGGTGLGLSICSKLSIMMGGHITLKSELGVGSTFTVDLPFWKSQETRAMDIIECSGLKIALACCEQKIPEKAHHSMQHLQHAGVNLFQLNNMHDLHQNASFDILFIIIDDLLIRKTELINTLSILHTTQNIILATSFKDIEQTRNLFNNVKIIDFDALTKVHLIETIQKMRTSLHTLNLDITALTQELNQQLNSDLTLDIPIDNLISPSSKKTQQKSLKNGILIVEDNDLNQKLIVKQLANIGYQCDVADDGKEGEKKWLNGNYKLILTDCHMPNIDGYEMTKLIRKHEKLQGKNNIPIIAITGAAMAGDSDYCYEAGMNDFVSKPVQQSDLKKVLDKWYQL